MTKAVKKAAKRQKLAIPAEAARKLRAVAKHILEEPKRLYMGAWVLRKEEAAICGFDNLAFAKCGTVACIAGWTTLLFTPPERLADTRGREANVAAGLLNLTHSDFTDEDDLTRLFYLVNWPKVYKERYRSAKTPRARAKAAAERIEHFIQTGK